MRGASHVEAPYAVSDIVGDATRRFCMSFQPPDPVVECQAIVLPQTLDIPYLRSRNIPPLEGWY